MNFNWILGTKDLLILVSAPKKKFVGQEKDACLLITPSWGKRIQTELHGNASLSPTPMAHRGGGKFLLIENLIIPSSTIIDIQNPTSVGFID